MFKFLFGNLSAAPVLLRFAAIINFLSMTIISIILGVYIAIYGPQEVAAYLGHIVGDFVHGYDAANPPVKPA